MQLYFIISILLAILVGINSCNSYKEADFTHEILPTKCLSEHIKSNIFKVYSREDKNCMKLTVGKPTKCWAIYNKLGQCELFFNEMYVLEKRKEEIQRINGKCRETLMWAIFSLWIILTYIRNSQQVFVRVEKYS